MSTTIDNRVLEMRFDNQQFEKGVATSMSTLDKLKQKLNLSGASKGLDDLSKATKNVNFSGMTNGIDIVTARFSAMQVAGMTAIANITNSAVNAGKRMVDALTLEPVRTGLQEYETQINSVQTILANVGHKGKTLADVNAALKELNDYADLTIYNFTEMTRNIGLFTNAGVGLDESVASIKGFSNAAAMAGADATRTAGAMYQLSQAMSTGRIQLMDWRSLENANIPGERFQDALKETARAHGIAIDAMIEKNGAFRDTLKEGWLTADLMSEALNHYTLSTDHMTKAEQEAAKAKMESNGYTDEQIDKLFKLGTEATRAATQVKTFSQLWGVMQEAAQSGWSKTWEIIIGDFEEARSLLTPLSDFFTGIIGNISNWRNTLLEGALGKGFTDLSEKINKVIEPAKKAADAVKEVTTTVQDLGGVVDDVISGKLGNGQERFDKLTEAGYNWCEVQNKVNETLGSSFRYTKEQIEAQNKLLGSQKKTTEETSKTTEEISKSTEETKKLTDAQREQIKELKEVKDAAEKLGMPLDTFIDKMDEINGRWLLINSFKNIGESLGKVFGAFGGAWREVFDPIKPEQIFDAIAAVHKFTSSLIMSGDAAEDLQRTFKGLFAALDIVTTIAGGGIKFAFKTLSTILSAFDKDILDLTGNIGDSIYKFRDWLFEQNAVAKAMNGFVGKLPGYINKLKSWFSAFKETPVIQKFTTVIEEMQAAFDKLTSGEIDIANFAKTLGSGFANALKSLPDIAVQVGKDFIAGFQNGISEGFGSGIIGDIVSFCLEFVSSFAEALGVQSPSWKAYDIAVDFIQGFINGIKNMAGNVAGTIKGIGEQIVKIFKSFWDFITDESGNIQWGNLFAGGIVVSMIVVIKKIADAVGGLTDILGGFGNLCDAAAGAIKRVGKAIATDFKAKAMQKMAVALLMMVAAVWVISKIETPDLIKAVAAIGILAGILVALAIAMSKMSDASIKLGKEVNIDGLKTGLLQIGIALVLLAAIVKLIGDMDPEHAKQGFIALAGLAVGLLAFIAALEKIEKAGSYKHIDKVGNMLTKLAVAMLLMIAVVKLVDGLSAEAMLQGAAFAVGFAIFVRAITAVAKGSDKHISKVGGMVLKLSIAMLLMVGVCKLAGMLSVGDMLKGVAFMAAFVIFVKYLVNAATYAKGNKFAKIGGMMLAISTSLLLLVGVCKLVGMLSVSEMIKGAAFMAAFVLLIKAMVKITTIGNDQKMIKVAGTILAMSAAIAILAGISVLLGMMELSNLAKGITAVGLLSLMMTAMIKALKGAQNVKGSIMMMAVAIGIMTASVVALSFIEPGKLAGASAALAILMGMFAFIEKSSGNITKSLVPLAAMIVAVGLLAGILFMLTNIIKDADAAIKIAASLGILLGALSLSMTIISKTGYLSSGAIKSMAGMVLILGGVAVVLGLMSKFNINPSIETATSLSILLLSLAGVTVILTSIGSVAPAALGGVAAFAIVVAGVGLLITALGALNEQIPSLETFLDSGIPILEKIGTGIGKFVGGLIGGIGEGLMDSLVQMVSQFKEALNGLAEASDIGATIKPEGFDAVKQLLDILSSIGSTTVGTTFSDIFTLGGTSMDKFQTEGVAFFKAMKEISSASSGVTIDENGMNAVIGVAQKLVDLQSSLNSIDGVMSWFTGKDDLASFGTNVGQFIDAIKTAIGNLDDVTVNEEALGSIVDATAKLSKLQSSLEPIGGIITWFNGRDDLATFGVNIGVFLYAMKNALSNLDDMTVNEEALGSIVTASSDLSKLQSSLEPIGGVISWFNGRDDLATFGVNVGRFLCSMKTAMTNLDGVTVNEEALGSIVTAAMKLSELQSKLESMGGVISWFTGRSDLGTFGTKIELFAEAMGTLKENVGENGITEAAVASITNAGSALIALQEALPEEGWFDGKMNLTDFSGYISDFSKAMSDFSTNASNIDSEGINTSINAANRIKYLIDSLIGLDTSGLATFTGIGVGGFGADGAVSNLGKAIAAYSNEISGIDTSKVSTSVSAALALKGLIAELAGLDASGIENFKIDSIGSSMQNYASKISGIDISAISNSISVASKLKSFISSLSGMDSSGVGTFVSAVDQLGAASIDGVVKSFNGASSSMLSAGSDLIESVTKGMKSRQSSLSGTVTNMISTAHKAVTSKASLFMSAGSMLITKLASGISGRASAVSSAVTSAISSAAGSIRAYYGSFYSAGSYLGSGLVIGINSMRAAAYSAGYSLGQAAAQGEKDGQKSASPSKLTIQAGKWLGEGLIIGIKAMGSKAYKAGYTLGDKTANSISSAMSKASELFNIDTDMEPTIRPVVDLSDVTYGANAIRGMFGYSLSVGASANLGAISRMSTRQNQNGGNAEVISAINKLGKALDKMDRPSYTINGVTYDDGSNIAEAVSSIVRAAKIERRV